MKIDFGQLSHEELEFLAEDLMRAMGFTIVSRPARGPDRGKDLIATRDTTDDMGLVEHEQYLVECKHYFLGGGSVVESKIGNVESQMKIHECNRYLLITTTTVSEKVKDQLIAISSDTSNARKATFWHAVDLTDRLEQYPELIEKYFFSWESETRFAAQYVHDHHFSAHRGAILWCPGITAIFGNDGYEPAEDQPFSDAHQRTRDEIVTLLKSLTDRNIKELAFETSEDGYTWAILVRSSDAREMNDLVWECYPISDGSGSSLQKGEALTRLNSYWTSPHKKRCCGKAE